MSRWLKWSSSVDDFYPQDRSRPCYGFYSPAVDRLILVDSKDLFLSLQVAILFSSKLLLLIVPFDPTKHPVDNSTCYFWSPGYRVPQSAYQLPQIFPVIGTSKSLVYCGPSPHTTEEKLIQAQEFLGFVAQASFALHLAEAIHNVNDTECYQRFFPEFEPAEAADRAHFREVERILYRFSSIDQAMLDIDEVLSKELDRLTRRRYYARFNTLLYGQPAPPFK
jgi:hypothetical protein